jgi:hypothetical protein
MHARVVSSLVVSAALSCGTQGASAQTAYSYAWCGINGGGENCYYSTREQCIATTAGGRGGRCFESPYYRRDAVPAKTQQSPAARVADRAVVQQPRAALVANAPERRIAQPNGVAPSLRPDQLTGQDYGTVLGSAEQGDATAQYNLAIMYDSGRGVPQDYVMAHKWYNLAASRFQRWEADVGASAIRNRDRLTARMTPAQVAEAQKMARDWEPKQGR